MKKALIYISILIVILAGTVIISGGVSALTENTIKELPLKTETVAICDDYNFCEDHTIICQEKNPIKIIPTGYVAQFDKNWEDPRTLEEKEFCN